ncbi:MAG: phage terminase small subunit P27 family [Candidatus Obscuribacterales bacterium]|nr:phage terminase small subunit P27 family [Candidatus Obscuribacterales bacterium]
MKTTSQRGRRLSACDQAIVESILEIPAPPDWLDAEAKDVWNRLAPPVVRLGLLSEMDADLFGRLCTLYATGIRCDRLLSTEGSHLPVGNQMHPRPELKLSRESWKQAEKLALHFGLLPTGRQRMGLKLTPPRLAESESEKKTREMLTGHR